MYCIPSILYLLCIPLQSTAYTQSSEQFSKLVDFFGLFFFDQFRVIFLKAFWLKTWAAQSSLSFEMTWCQETQQLWTSELPVIHKGKKHNQIGQLKISSCLILTLLHLIHVTSQTFSNHCHCPTYKCFFVLFFKSSMVKSKRRECQNLPIFFIRFIHDLVYITAHAMKTVLLGEKINFLLQFGCRLLHSAIEFFDFSQNDNITLA